MNKRWLRLSVVVGLVFMLAVPVLADFQAGLVAAKRGDYDTALKEFRPLADQGDARAQSSLGQMYFEGLGVPQDYQEAAKWFRLAGNQGDAYAQITLGVMYAQGQGVPQDFGHAAHWYRLAAEQGEGPAHPTGGYVCERPRRAAKLCSRVYVGISRCCPRVGGVCQRA